MIEFANLRGSDDVLALARLPEPDPAQVVELSASQVRREFREVKRLLWALALDQEFRKRDSGIRLKRGDGRLVRHSGAALRDRAMFNVVRWFDLIAGRLAEIDYPKTPFKNLEWFLIIGHGHDKGLLSHQPSGKFSVGDLNNYSLVFCPMYNLYN